MTLSDDLIGQSYGNNGNEEEEQEKEAEDTYVDGKGKGRKEKRDQVGKDKDAQIKPKLQYPSYKYSNRGKGALHEAAIVVGLPVFLKYENSEIKTVAHIEGAVRIIRSPNVEEYPYEPYEFANIAEVQSYYERAKKESIDSLYLKAKSIVNKYNDQDENKLILLAADIVWSYFQDKFSTTHYVGVVGDNGSGKSTIGDTFEAAGYRAVNMTDPTAANIFRVLGRIEYGQCTIVADEAEKIDKSSDIMSVLKTGYQIKGKVARMNMNNETQQFFYTYCLKMIIAERSPNQSDAKGVLDRTFMFTSYKGKPQYDIKEVLNPVGDKGRQELLDELIDFRKLMLVYRLIHFKDPIPDIDIGLDGRDKELCKPIVQLFNKTDSEKEIRTALLKFLHAKNQRKGNLIEAALHPIIVNLVSIDGREVPAGRIWREIVETLEGSYDSKKPNEYQSADYGTLYRNTITNIICDKFGAERKHSNSGSILIFDLEKLVKVGKVYDLETNIQTKVTEHKGDSGDGSDSYTEDMDSSKQNSDVEV
jgi:hypothetical protein